MLTSGMAFKREIGFGKIGSIKNYIFLFRFECVSVVITFLLVYRQGQFDSMVASANEAVIRYASYLSTSLTVMKVNEFAILFRKCIVSTCSANLQ